MQQFCSTECEDGLRAGTIPKAGELWQADDIECLTWRLAGACASHPNYMKQHCVEACAGTGDGDPITFEMPPSDFLSQVGALLLLCGFCYTVFHAAKIALTHDAQFSWHTRRAMKVETAAESAALAAQKASKAGKKKSMTYQERMQARRNQKVKQT
mmetsp:Transcript_3579/g.9951  ORF Transcript_3579/g.9951 Transcript_3579/m.9951 type:complete len:156 (-) Transcript_3579:739-1206(-)